MKTNDLKKGDIVRLRSGWFAKITDNMRGNTRMAEVYGRYTETGSVYAHDIMLTYRRAGLGDSVVVSLVDLPEPLRGTYVVHPVEHTDKQRNLRNHVRNMGL